MKKIHTYIFGFTFSLVLTAAAFGLAQMHLDSGHTFPAHEFAIVAFVVLAIVQLFVQLFLFLHIGDEPKPRLGLLALLFALLTVSIVVGGTLWIMYNLSHRQTETQPNVFTEENIFPNADHNAN